MAEEKNKKSSKEENKLGIKVLLVEDDVFLHKIIEKKLTKEGYIVFKAVDGKEAVDLVEKVKPDVVLLDILLPILNGFEVLEKIRANADSKINSTPVIILSNLGQDEDIKKAMELGANQYLVKVHFTTDEISNKIKKVLNQ